MRKLFLIGFGAVVLCLAGSGVGLAQTATVVHTGNDCRAYYGSESSYFQAIGGQLWRPADGGSNRYSVCPIAFDYAALSGKQFAIDINVYKANSTGTLTCSTAGYDSNGGLTVSQVSQSQTVAGSGIFQLRLNPGTWGNTRMFVLYCSMPENTYVANYMYYTI